MSEASEGQDPEAQSDQRGKERKKGGSVFQAESLEALKKASEVLKLKWSPWSPCSSLAGGSYGKA